MIGIAHVLFGLLTVILLLFPHIFHFLFLCLNCVQLFMSYPLDHLTTTSEEGMLGVSLVSFWFLYQLSEIHFVDKLCTSQFLTVVKSEIVRCESKYPYQINNDISFYCRTKSKMQKEKRKLFTKTCKICDKNKICQSTRIISNKCFNKSTFSLYL